MSSFLGDFCTDNWFLGDFYIISVLWFSAFYVNLCSTKCLFVFAKEREQFMTLQTWSHLT